MAVLFWLGAMTVSKAFSPLIPTSSSCLNFDDGGYLCQPRSSSKLGPFIRSKLPRPEIVAVTVIGSPTMYDFASWPYGPNYFSTPFARRNCSIMMLP